MKVISLWQPFATLVIIGCKEFETRGWDTKYRGPLAIHATASMPKECIELCSQSPFKETLERYGYGRHNLPLGKILGTVDLTGTVTTEKWIEDRTNFMGLFMSLWNSERAFGNYDPERFAWELRNPVQFAEPIPAKGMQGFWNFDLPLAQI